MVELKNIIEYLFVVRWIHGVTIQNMYPGCVLSPCIINIFILNQSSGSIDQSENVEQQFPDRYKSSIIWLTRSTNVIIMTINWRATSNTRVILLHVKTPYQQNPFSPPANQSVPRYTQSPLQSDVLSHNQSHCTSRRYTKLPISLLATPDRRHFG